MSGLTLANNVSAEIGDLKLSDQTNDHGKWLKCTQGRTVSRSTYALLFAVLGTKHGSGDGSTTFNLPSAEGRALGVAGSGSGLTSRSIGQKVGAEQVALSETNNGPHDHDGYYLGGGSRGRYYDYTGGTKVAGTASMDMSGSGTPHQNMQPTNFIGNLFIYAGV